MQMMDPHVLQQQQHLMASIGGGVPLRMKNRNLIEQAENALDFDQVDAHPQELSSEEQFKLSKKLYAEQLKQELLYGKKPKAEKQLQYGDEEDDSEGRGEEYGEEDDSEGRGEEYGEEYGSDEEAGSK